MEAHRQATHKLIQETTEMMFEAKESLGDGVYVEMMGNMKQLYDLAKIQPAAKKPPARSTIAGVMRAWINMEEAHTSNGSITTRNGYLWSYNVQIGYTHGEDEYKCVVDHTAGGIGFISTTASRHVLMAARYCNDNGILLRVINGDDY